MNPDPPVERPLVLAAHGTHDPRGQAAIHRLAGLVGDRLGRTPRVGWVDVIGPELDSVLVPDAVLVPCFLGTGYHVRVDVPRAARTVPGVSVTAAFGPAPEILGVLRERLRQLDGPPPDAVVLGAAGSSDPLSLAESAGAAAMLENGLGLPVAVGYLSAARPSVAEAVARLRDDGHRRVAVVSYLLAPGYFADQLHAAGADAVTPPLAPHPDLAELVVQRYRTAQAGTPVTVG